MIIAISGLHGTGKSTIAKLIAEALELNYYSTGKAFRELAKEKGKSLNEFTKFVETHPNIDLELDQKIIEIAKQGNVIIDSQLSGFLLSDIADFKIYLTCPIQERVKRIAERDDKSYEEKLKETTLRENSELNRFKKLYNIDLMDLKSINETFNLIINTENLTLKEIINRILFELDKID